MQGTLYLIGTPIGNMGDISSRALELLQQVDFIAAEDTRVTLKLLNKFGIKKNLISYYEHSQSKKEMLIVEKILNGENCGLVTDAGMPCISDPGEKLVKLAIECGIKITSAPSASAYTTALALSGLRTSRFTFEGFLSKNKKNRKKHLEEIAKFPHTLIFYEAPHKLLDTLVDLQNYLGNRKISIARELTKIYEEILRFETIKESIDHFNITTPRGEFVLIIDGYQSNSADCEVTFEEAVLSAKNLVASGHSKTEASKKIANKTPFSKSSIYAKLIK